MGPFKQPGNEFGNFDVNASVRRITVAVTGAMKRGVEPEPVVFYGR
ncbi:hypothetical protein BSLA_03f0684 [Burkholderia stabilis]|nr:hypothetical protein BSLA_03f0684 [Burkholderia stabilis]